MPRSTTSSISRRTRTVTADSEVPAWVARSGSKQPQPDSGKLPAALPERAKAATPERPIVCRRCGEALSDSEALFTMSDTRSFVNPSGILYEVVTVLRAKNLEVDGPPTTDFTWYPGFAWEIAHCARCGAHVGWSFTTVDDGDPPRFWALRRDAIAEKI